MSEKKIDFNQYSIEPPKDGHEAAAYYQWYRDNRQMRRELFRERIGSAGKVYACALGAAFGAHDSTQCNYDIAPEWLAEMTPGIFDQMSRHLLWADAVYGKGGIVDRAAYLPLKQRNAVWEETLKEVAKRIRCTLKPDHWTIQNSVSDYVLVENFVDGPHRSPTAWTIVEVAEQLLTEAGV